MTTSLPIPANEMDRIIKLSDFDLDYAEMQESFKNLTKLAAKVAGTEISLINLIDTYTQWTVSNYGLPLDQMPREDSVCQYTIVSKEFFEVENLADDDRFKDKFYVVEPPKLRYYFGVPLQTEDGYNIGALCVLDKIGKEITAEKIELLKIIADEIVNRFTALRVIQGLRNKVKEANETRKRVAHDIRGPLGGIINLAQLISEQGDTNKMEEVLMFISMIQKSGASLLDLADEILSMEKKVDTHTEKPSDNQLNLLSLKNKLEKLYAPQALNKKINFSVTTSVQTEHKPFLKNKLLQIIGNLISNAIKFTPPEGSVTVNLDLVTGADKNMLQINVSDSGIGLDEQARQYILAGSASSTQGTNDEQGYGFGLALVKHLVTGLNGTMDIQSTPGEGAIFKIEIPQNRL